MLWAQVRAAADYLALVTSGTPVLAGSSIGAAEVAALMLQWRALSNVAGYVRSAASAATAVSLPYVSQLLSGSYEFSGVALGLVALWPPRRNASVVSFDPLEVCQMLMSGPSATPSRLDGDAALRLWLLRGSPAGVAAADAEAEEPLSSLDMASVETSVLDEDLFEEHRDGLCDLGPPAPEQQRRLLLISYLERLVMGCAYRGSQVVTLLALQYVAVITEAVTRGGGAALVENLLTAIDGCVAEEDKAPADSGQSASRAESSGAEFIVHHFRGRLHGLLTSPAGPSCDASVVLRAFPTRGLAAERVLLLRALGQHGAAIAVLVRDVGDLDGAEQYCHDVSDPDKEGSGESTTSGLAPYLSLTRSAGGGSFVGRGDFASSVHDHFVQAALSPCPAGAVPSPATVSRIVGFVSKNLAHSDPAAALRLLPDATPLADLSDFIESAVQHTRNSRRTLAISRQLALLQWQRARWLLLQRQTSRGSVCEVDRVTVCALCDRRLAPTGPEAFVRQPNGALEHLACDRESRAGEALASGSAASGY